MSEDEIVLMGANDNIQDDMILPFQLESSHLRGRVIRLGSVLQDILTPHAYPDPVAQLVGEACGLSLLLGGMLKFDGVFTLQAQGSGPVRLVVADLTTGGDLRGMASFDQNAFSDIPAAHPLRASDRSHALNTLMGTGYLAFTVDQGPHTDRYQGIVELKESNLVDGVAHYFDQSEQIDTMIKLACGRVEGLWRAGGVMIQRLPVRAEVQTPEQLAQLNEDWDRAQALLATCTPDELIKETLFSNDLLYRLFHEEGVRVFNPVHLRKGCRCDGDKLSGILKTLSPDDRSHMTVEGKIQMTCEFCSKTFSFDPQELTS